MSNYLSVTTGYRLYSVSGFTRDGTPFTDIATAKSVWELSVIYPPDYTIVHIAQVTMTPVNVESR